MHKKLVFPLWFVLADEPVEPQRETVTTTANGTSTTEVLDFIYGSGSTPLALVYTNGTASPVTYYYITNMQGDVVKLVTASGTTVASYTYDAWGKVLSATGSMAEVNPIRYRGYYYDTEMELYYLQSRYYDPIVKRFINADMFTSTGRGLIGYNMFAYCGNNPILSHDPSGTCEHVCFLIGWLIDCEDCHEEKERKKKQKVKYDVPLYGQNSSSLCWAYCELMIDSYESGEKLSSVEAFKSAYNIAVSEHGTKKWDSAGVPTDVNVDDAIEVKDIEELYDLLLSGPVYAFYCNEDPYHPSGNRSSHYVVVTGVNVYKDQVYTNNPWGVAGVQTFNDFLGGVAENRTKKDYTGMVLWYIFVPQE